DLLPPLERLEVLHPLQLSLRDRDARRLTDERHDQRQRAVDVVERVGGLLPTGQQHHPEHDLHDHHDLSGAQQVPEDRGRIAPGPGDRAPQRCESVGGDRATAMEAVRRVKRRHASVRGTDPVTGREYSADDPDTQVWVHITEWHSFLAAYRVFAGGLSPDDEDRYIREGTIIGSLLGTPRERIPGSVADAGEYFAAVRPELRSSDWARDAIRFVLEPPLTRELLPFQV